MTLEFFGVGFLGSLRKRGMLYQWNFLHFHHLLLHLFSFKQTSRRHRHTRKTKEHFAHYFGGNFFFFFGILCVKFGLWCFLHMPHIIGSRRRLKAAV